MGTEHQRIERIRALFSRSLAPEIVVGIGDDCAVLAQPKGASVWTIDSAVEDVHFRRDCMTLDAIGFRSFMAAASDIAAMGARTTAALSALVLPTSLSDQELDALLGGIARAAEACACPIVGGNLARGRELSLTTTVLGQPYDRALLRSGASAGDGLFVTGVLGSAALGMLALFSNRKEAVFAECAAAFLAPRARLDVAENLSRVATSAIDVSDGLVQDVQHLCRASRLSAEIALERIPRLLGFDALAARLQSDALQALVAGGEDYELLFTAAADTNVAGWATRIGTMRAGASETRLLDASGSLVSVRSHGFDHFR